MKKSQEQLQDGEEMFEYNENNPNIGTEILDNALPSDINFDAKPKNQFEGVQISKDNKYSHKNKQPSPADSIRMFTVKGNVSFDAEQKHYEGSTIRDGTLQTYDVKGLDEQKSSGMKSIWETIVGYVKRQVFWEEGYFYIVENTKEGYYVHSVLKLIDLFKVFSDPEENKVRLVFRAKDKKLITKNFVVKSCEDFTDKINEELSRIGLVAVASD